MYVVCFTFNAGIAVCLISSETDIGPALWVLTHNFTSLGLDNDYNNMYSGVIVA